MKYLKTYENSQNFKRFSVSEFTEPALRNANRDELHVLQIWEILGEHTDRYSIRKRYEYTNEDGLKEEENNVQFSFPKDQMYNDVIFQTDDLEEALDFIDIKIQSKKYNL